MRREKNKIRTIPHTNTTMPKGANKKKRAKKRRQERERERARAASADVDTTTTNTMRAADVPHIVQQMAAAIGASPEEVMQARQRALQSMGHMTVGELQDALGRVRHHDSSKLHTSIEQTRGACGGDYHCWFETEDGKIYNLPGGERIAGDIPKYNKDNPRTPYNLREAYPPQLQKECYETYMVPYLQLLELLQKKDADVKSKLLAKVMNPSVTWENKCVNRAAVLIFLGIWSKDALRFGGVGWVGSDGKPHFEFG